MSERNGLPMPDHKRVLLSLAARTGWISATKIRIGGAMQISAAAIGMAACLVAGCGSDDNVGNQVEGALSGSGAVSGAAVTGTANATGGTGASSVGSGGLAKGGKAGTRTNAVGGKGGKSGGVAGKGKGGTAGKGGAAAPDKCDKIPASSTDCNAPLAPGDDRKCTIQVGAATRSYYMYAPPTYNPCTASALVVDCHGAMETAEEHAGLDDTFAANGMEWPGEGSGWRLEANTKGGGFIVATPQGISNAWSAANNDPAFFLAVIEQIKKVANIDAKKVYQTGISNGSAITYSTVCPNTDVFAGFAPHAAGGTCASISKPIPVISFDAEPDFAYASTVASHDTMVQLNKCTGTENPTWLVIDSKTTDAVCRNDPYDTNPKLVPCNTIKSTSITPNGIEPTVCRRTDGCEGGVAVVFCEVAPSTLHGAINASSDAHIIYGNATSLNTASVAWRFFKSFWQ